MKDTSFGGSRIAPFNSTTFDRVHSSASTSAASDYNAHQSSLPAGYFSSKPSHCGDSANEDGRGGSYFLPFTVYEQQNVERKAAERTCKMNKKFSKEPFRRENGIS